MSSVVSCALLYYVTILTLSVDAHGIGRKSLRVNGVSYEYITKDVCEVYIAVKNVPSGVNTTLYITYKHTDALGVEVKTVEHISPNHIYNVIDCVIAKYHVIKIHIELKTEAGLCATLNIWESNGKMLQVLITQESPCGKANNIGTVKTLRSFDVISGYENILKINMDIELTYPDLGVIFSSSQDWLKKLNIVPKTDWVTELRPQRPNATGVDYGYSKTTKNNQNPFLFILFLLFDIEPNYARELKEFFSLSQSIEELNIVPFSRRKSDQTSTVNFTPFSPNVLDFDYGNYATVISTNSLMLLLLLFLTFLYN